MSNPQLVNYVNGIGQVTSDGLNSFFQTCTNMAQLRGFAGNNPAISVFVRGTATANDGGQGYFYWNSTITGTDDNGVTTVVPSGVTIGCWIRQNIGTTLLATSNTSNTIGTGTKNFTITQSSSALVIGGFVAIVSQANVTNYMSGQITGFSGGVLTVNVTNTGGSGTFSDWEIILSGAQGSSGSAPAFNTITNGTNTAAAMVVGSGSSLSVSGTGTIAATSSLVSSALASATATVSVSSATAPTTGQVLTATSGTTAVWQSPSSGSSAMILLSTIVASSSASIIFDSTVVTGAYDNYKIIANNVSGSTSTEVDLDMAIAGTYGGSTWNLGWTTYTGSVTTTSGSTTILTGNVNLSTSNTCRGWIDITGVTSNVKASLHSTFSPLGNNQVETWSIVNGAAVFNGIKITPVSGTIVTGTFKLYGIL